MPRSARTRRHTRASGLVGLAAVLAATPALAGADFPWPATARDGTVADRIAPPEGYEREAVANGSFASWLRGLPVRPGRPKVHTFDGSLKGNQTAHHRVLDIDIGSRDLQQCADAAMRLRAEWLRSEGRGDETCFRFTSGDAASWKRWRAGWRPRVDGGKVSWAKSAPARDDYRTFRKYLERVFLYAGTASLEKELETIEPEALRAGDLFIQGGFPGHAVLVMDVARSESGDRVFLLAQSYMPAQDIHVLENPNGTLGPWYRLEPTGELVTPEWTFRWSDLKRFPEETCAPAFRKPRARP